MLLTVVFALLAVSVVGRWVPLVAVDERIEASAHALMLSHPALLGVVVTITDTGSPVSVDVIAGLVAAGLLARHRIPAAVYVVTARLVELGVETGVKHLVARPRPVLVDPVGHAGGFSFPSGHSAGTAVLCLSVLIVARAALDSRSRFHAGALVTFVVLAVAASRVLLGVHYPSDVLGGVVLGAACAIGASPLLRGCPWWHYDHGEARA